MGRQREREGGQAPQISFQRAVFKIALWVLRQPLLLRFKQTKHKDPVTPSAQNQDRQTKETRGEEVMTRKSEAGPPQHGGDIKGASWRSQVSRR